MPDHRPEEPDGQATGDTHRSVSDVRAGALPAVDHHKPASVDVLTKGGGETGALIRALDWAATPFGPIERWPASLRAVVNLMMLSRSQIMILWGREHIQLYNDGYRPILGATKHPGAMGQRCQDCWSEIWPTIEPQISAVMDRGESTDIRDGLLCMERNGYMEECYFHYAFSPITDETGAVDGVFAAVTESTESVIARRHERTIRDLNVQSLRTYDIDELWRHFTTVLVANRHDLQFCMLYLVHGTSAELALAVGLAAGAPSHIDLATDTHVWRAPPGTSSASAYVCSGAARHVVQAPGGPWPEPAKDLYVTPLVAMGIGQPLGFLVTGLNPRRALDDAYRAFIDVVTDRIASGLVVVRAYEQERKRADALMQLDHAKTEFFSNISHEFRTPLTLLLGPLEEALGHPALPLDPLIRDLLVISQRNALRLLKLVNTLLDYSRVEAGRVHAIYRPTKLAEATTDLASAFRSMIMKAGLTLHVDCPAIADPVYVDHDMWEKIVLNLISNAFKYTLTGSINVRQRQVGQVVELIVSDTGIGIAPDELPRVFERFHRIANARGRTQEGSGIGLALVHELVRLHGGTVVVASKLGHGSAFTVTLPVGKAHLSAERIECELPAISVAAEPYLAEARCWLFDEGAGTLAATLAMARQTHGAMPVPPSSRSDEPLRPRILVADDNVDMRMYLQRLLSPHYEIELVADGRQALAAAIARPPDLVLTDIMMPELDGFALLAALREDERTRAVPVVMVSARAGEEASVDGLQSGADDYVVKPFTARDLLARITSNLRLLRMRQELSDTKALARSEADYGHRLTQRNIQLDQANAELEQFAYLSSHDLREPLRMITQYMGILERDLGAGLSPRNRQHFAYAVDAAKRMQSLIADLLVFTQTSRMTEPSVPIDLNLVMTEVIELLRPRIADSGATIDAQRLPIVLGVKAKLILMFQELLDNALTYRLQRPSLITIWAEAQPGACVVHVRDNGIGIDPAYHAKIFGVFQRLHPAQEYPGTGIGLAICRMVARQHGGEIDVNSELGHGATFTIRLSTQPTAQGTP